ncbi:sulfite exporter TauE/SafE family protein [Wukongibacter baidiensis]|uniref:urease accessory protein UreH domain-containing protein n=1 Tax=Wukongibacter baidiensis TaxID=1723361 RepID=UPI003D7FADB2
MEKISFNIDGMVCANCERRIEGNLLMVEGVEEAKASMKKSKVDIIYDGNKVDTSSLIKTIEKQGYEVIFEARSSFKTVIPLVILLFAGFYIIQNTIGFNFIPKVTEEMGYGLILMVGLLTSIHCIAMCGGLALSQSVGSETKARKFTPSLLYNGGRIISYTIIGGLVGGLGGIISPSGQFKGIVAVFAGVFMFALGLKMLNIIHLPSWIKLKMPKLNLRVNNVSSPLAPLFVGLLNGFMPCGPLQTMQLYALGTGSVMKGALSMFFFSLGTVPLMFGFGAITSLIGRKSGKKIMKLSAVLVMALGIIMLNRGLALSGISLNIGGTEEKISETNQIEMKDGKQIINLTIKSNQYVPDVKVVKAGVPVQINLDVLSVNGCNNPISIPQYGIERNLMSKDNIIEFTPDKEGSVTITCWMGMITTQLVAVNDLNDVDTKDLEESTEFSLPQSDGCSDCQ